MPRENRPQGDPRTRLYNSAAWKRTRRTVLDRDGHECVRCHQEANSVHHITPMVELLRLGRDPLDESECVTMCRSCHGLADSPIKPAEKKPNRFTGWL